MCQLTLANFNDIKLNRLFTAIQAYENTRVSHDDGFGMFQKEHLIYKTQLEPYLTTNFGEFLIGAIVNNNPVISHVRLATYSGNSKVVSDENAHPFESSRLILAHNGTLEFQEEKKVEEKKYEDMIDTQVFLHRLQELVDKLPKKPLANRLSECMKEFYGKFAFLVYDKKKEEYYVARGKTAELHYVEIFQKGKNHKIIKNRLVGWVINTDKKNLEKSITKFIHLSHIADNSLPPMMAGEIKELEKETIYKVRDGKLIQISSIIENTKPTVTHHYSRNVVTRPQYPMNYGYNSQMYLDMDHELTDRNVLIFELMDDLNLSLPDIDVLLMLTYGKGILGIRSSELDEFVDIILPALKKEATTTRSTKWRKILTKYEHRIFSLYAEKGKLGLQYPWMLNSSAKLQKVLTEFHREVKK